MRWVFRYHQLLVTGLHRQPHRKHLCLECTAVLALGMLELLHLDVLVSDSRKEDLLRLSI